MTTKHWITATLVAALGLSSVAIARPPAGGPPWREVLEALDLSDSQRELARALHEERRDRMKERRENRKDDHEAFLTQLASDRPDARALHRQIDERAQRIAADQHADLDQLLEFHATLSKEQREELVEQLRERHEQRGEHPRGGGQRPPRGD